MKKPESPKAPSALIDQRIAELGDWRGKMLAKMRKLIHDADPEVIEEWKWMGTPTFYHGAGIICTGETYKQVVKLTFAKGAALADPSKLFNSSLEGNVRRAIDIREDDKVNESAFKALVRAAVTLIESGSKPKSAASKPAKPVSKTAKTTKKSAKKAVKKSPKRA